MGSRLLVVPAPDGGPPAGSGRHHPDLPGGHAPAWHQAVLGGGPAHRRPALLVAPTRCAERPALTSEGASEAEKLVYEAKFNQRARWRLVRHAGPDTDGVTRWRCPFCAGLLRSRKVPKTMRSSRRAPLVELPGDKGAAVRGSSPLHRPSQRCSNRFPLAPPPGGSRWVDAR